MGFLREFRSSLENPSTPLSYPAEWLLDIFNGGRTDSGIRVSELTALQISTVYACVDLISGAMASIDLNVYEQLDRGKRLAFEHDAARAVRLILLHAIGTFHSIGREVAHHVDSPRQVPAAGVIRRRDHRDGSVTYYTRRALTGAAASFARPELSAQVWARAHARLAEAPGGHGFMNLGPDVTLGMFGDALYTTVPGTPADWITTGASRIGAYRIKGLSNDPRPVPTSVAGLLALRDSLETV